MEIAANNTGGIINMHTVSWETDRLKWKKPDADSEVEKREKRVVFWLRNIIVFCLVLIELAIQRSLQAHPLSFFSFWGGLEFVAYFYIGRQGLALFVKAKGWEKKILKNYTQKPLVDLRVEFKNSNLAEYSKTNPVAAKNDPEVLGKLYQEAKNLEKEIDDIRKQREKELSAEILPLKNNVFDIRQRIKIMESGISDILG